MNSSKNLFNYDCFSGGDRSTSQAGAIVWARNAKTPFASLKANVKPQCTENMNAMYTTAFRAQAITTVFLRPTHFTINGHRKEPKTFPIVPPVETRDVASSVSSYFIYAIYCINFIIDVDIDEYCALHMFAIRKEMHMGMFISNSM